MIIPDTDVNLATEVRDVLNSYGGSVTNDTTTFFKSAANINKWAKYKPESYKKDFDLTENDRYLNNYGFDQYGINANIFSLFENAKNGDTWEYILPKGESDSPYRLGDFRGYNPNAVAPFDYHWISRSGASTSGTYSDTWRVLFQSGAEIKMSDLSLFANINSFYYLFVCRKASQSSYEYIISSLVPMSGDPDDIQCSITIPSTGTWECLFCMGQNISEDISSRTDLVALPNGYFTFSLSKKVIYVTCTYDSPNPPDVTYDSGTMELNLGTQFFYLTLSATADDTGELQSVPESVLTFGFEMLLLGSDNTEISDKVHIYSDDSNDEKVYSGTDTVSWMTVNFPQNIYLPNYFDEATIRNATTIRLVPTVKVLSGLGFARMDKLLYFDIAL